ncbi:MAG: hypothetical protein FJ404_06690 [Verrucomicrobia bacterium]|nr:hypothetical protein [Verrucomicrobiota bacterium]
MHHRFHFLPLLGAMLTSIFLCGQAADNDAQKESSRQPAPLGPATASPRIALQPQDTLVFYGGALVECLLENGELQSLFHLANPALKLRFRSLAWTGDEVGHRLRAEGYADHLRAMLARWPAQVVFLAFGGNESFAGVSGLETFRTHLHQMLDQLQRLHPNASWVLLAPTALEPGWTGPDASTRNADLARYSQVLAQTAEQRRALFIDLFRASQTAYSSSPSKLTLNGLHLNDAGNRRMARVIAESCLDTVLLRRIAPERLDEVRPAAARLAHFVAETVRPKNGILYYGQRKRPEERDAEMPLYFRRIDLAEALVHELSVNPSTRFSNAPPILLAPPPVPPSGGSTHSVGVVKSASEAQAEFTVAPDYRVNLFASDEEFPDLRAPVQIAFDARGRLWVVTMPSFPHTIPGQPQLDKLLVLEDTNRDGKADRSTVFAEGFDALDGIAFTSEGVLVSEQSRHWLLEDTDGDGRADRRHERLRGLDLTDSHHGGMIATDPVGNVWFSDGVFHRSQFETPWGVVRGVDATTYRLNPRSNRIESEWQSITPNPWKITFDRTGNIFQMYGDGLVLDGLALTWTPLGIYHPFAHAKILGYGKGSAAASISSPNFPPEYQQGIASAACVGPYLVSMTQFDLNQGMARARGRLDLVSSTNAAFRPVDVEFGFDGALYVSDFSSAIIGHAQHPMRDSRWNHVKGRIWRITHQGRPVVTNWPRILGGSVSDLLELLGHPQDLVRKHARLELRRQGRAVIADVEAWAARHLDEDQSVLEALFVLESFHETRPALLDRLQRSASPHHRAAAVRLARYQFDRIPQLVERLHTMAGDTHPRVQMEVVDAVAHLRPGHPEVEHALHALRPTQTDVLRMLEDLKQGTKPAKGRSVPVLETSPDTRVRYWQFLGEEARRPPVTIDTSDSSGERLGPGVFRTLVRSESAQPAILSTKHSFLDVRVNGETVLSHDSQWSSEQQAQFELKPGLNLLEIEYRKLQGRPPPAYLFDPVGQRLATVTLPGQTADLAAMASSWTETQLAGGGALTVRAAAGLQFSPKELRVKAGAKVRLVFENPDLMVHNWVLVQAGAGEEVGALADRMAADPQGMAKAYVPDSPQILAATPLVNPKGRAELRFEAPRNPGSYPFLCTFPGHWRLMRGVLIVTSEE